MGFLPVISLNWIQISHNSSTISFQSSFTLTRRWCASLWDDSFQRSSAARCHTPNTNELVYWLLVVELRVISGSSSAFCWGFEVTQPFRYIAIIFYKVQVRSPPRMGRSYVNATSLVPSLSAYDQKSEFIPLQQPAYTDITIHIYRRCSSPIFV